MDANAVIIDALGRVKESLELVLGGLDAKQLTYRPDEQANPIGWLAWHLTRVQDRQIADLAGQPDLWVDQAWHAKFGRPANSTDTGFRMTAEQVAAFEPPSPEVLVAYHAAVYERSVRIVRGLQPSDFERVLDESRWTPPPTVGIRLVSIVNDCAMHAGQMAYVRGLLERRHWFRA